MTLMHIRSNPTQTFYNDIYEQERVVSLWFYAQCRIFIYRHNYNNHS